MPVIARFYGIVIRLLSLGSLGTRLHACYGDTEMVLDLASLRILQNNVQDGVKEQVIAWAKEHQNDLLAGRWRKAYAG